MVFEYIHDGIGAMLLFLLRCLDGDVGGGALALPTVAGGLHDLAYRGERWTGFIMFYQVTWRIPNRVVH